MYCSVYVVKNTVNFFAREILFERGHLQKKVTTMPPKDKSEIEVVKKRKKVDPPVLLWNEETKRWVKKDGAVGKRIEEKKKEKEEQERKDKEQERKDKKSVKEIQELESENKRLKSLVVPSLLAASYIAPCVHHFADSRPHFGELHIRVCNICGKEWVLMVKSKTKAKTDRFLSAISNASIAAGVNSPFLETIAEKELEESSFDLPCSRRVGKSGLSSGLTLDFDSMSVQKDARKKGQGGAGCWGK